MDNPGVYIPLIVIGIVLVTYVVGNWLTDSAIVSSKPLTAGGTTVAELVYYLPAAALQLEVTATVVGNLNDDKSAVISAKLLTLDFVNTVSIIPDTAYGLGLRYKASAFSADEVKCKVDGSGLLSSVETTTDDRLAEIINEIAGAPDKLLESKGLAITARAILPEAPKTTNLTFEKTFYLPLTGKPQEAYPMPWTISIPGSASVEVDASFSLKFSENFRDFIPLNEITETDGVLTRPMQTVAMEIVTGPVETTGDGAGEPVIAEKEEKPKGNAAEIKKGADLKYQPEVISPEQGTEILEEGAKPKEQPKQDDVGQKPGVEVLLEEEEVDFKTGDTDDEIGEAVDTKLPATGADSGPKVLPYEKAGARLEYHFLITIPDTSRLINVPVVRSAFVKRTNAPKFISGLLVENAVNKPSQIEAFAAIPVSIGKALISVPARLLTFTVQNKKTELEAQKQLLLLQQQMKDKDGGLMPR